jgi:hypothetical protein
MITQERPPALGRHALAWSSTEIPGYVLVHRARRDLQAELEPQFVGNTALAPCEIVARHLPDKGLQLHWDRGASRVRCAVPEQSGPLVPPPFERFRLHHHESWVTVEPLRQPDQDETSGVAGASWLDVVLLIEGELLPQEQILSGQSRTRTEAEAQEAQDI